MLIRYNPLTWMFQCHSYCRNQILVSLLLFFLFFFFWVLKKITFYINRSNERMFDFILFFKYKDQLEIDA